MADKINLRDAAIALARNDISNEGLISVFNRESCEMDVSFDYSVHPHQANHYNNAEEISDPFSKLMYSLFQYYPELGCIAIVRSYYVHLWASAGGTVPPVNAFHVEHFYGEIPCTRRHLNYIDDLASVWFEDITTVIGHKDYIERPAVILQGFGGVVFGRTVEETVANAQILETVVRTAWDLTQKKSRPPYFGYSLMEHFRKMRGS